MAVTRRRRRPAGGRGSQSWNLWLGLAALALGVSTFVFSGISFIDGRYLTGRATNGGELRESWEAYGPGAYAGESPMHLLFAAGGLALIVLGVATLVARIRGGPVEYPIVGWIAAAIVGIAAAASLTLLIVNWSRGVPIHNFRPLGADGLLYAMWCIVPLLVLGAVGYAAVAQVRSARTQRAPIEHE
jgi:hypothetical protein